MGCKGRREARVAGEASLFSKLYCETHEICSLYMNKMRERENLPGAKVDKL